MASHECPATGCTRRVAPHMLMCKPHWYMVPGLLRTAVWEAWAGGLGAGSDAHDRAITEAIEVVNAKLAAHRG